jgi:hypothetical protein
MATRQWVQTGLIVVCWVVFLALCFAAAQTSPQEISALFGFLAFLSFVANTVFTWAYIASGSTAR